MRIPPGAARIRLTGETGNLLGAGSALLANLTGTQFAAKVALHGMAGGVMSTMGGGKFGHGFASAAGTQLSSVMIDQIGNGAASYKAHRIMAAAVVGGTVAEVTGGKFANGALTGAFSRAFNDELHSRFGDNRAFTIPKQSTQLKQLVDRANAIVNRDPGEDGTVLITDAELQTVMSADYGLLQFRMRQIGDYNKLGIAGFAYELRYHGDGMFYSVGNAGQVYNISDGVMAGFHNGGDINYYYQGFMNNAAGSSIGGMNMTISAWNRYQYVSGEGEFNLAQIPLGKAWAKYGYENYGGFRE